MKIAKVDCFVLSHKLGAGERFAYSRAWYDERRLLLVRIETDDGTVGWGETYGCPDAARAIVEKHYSPVLLGLDPRDHLAIWERLFDRLLDHGGAGTPIEALSAVDIALWDIKGKACGVPVWKLLGGLQRSRLRAYATGFYRTTEDPKDCRDSIVDEAQQRTDEGFSALKLKVGFGLEEDVRTVEAVRKKVGSAVTLMVDANHAYSAQDAVRLAKMISDFDVLWFEEPAAPDDLAGYRYFKSSGTGILAAGGENLFTRFPFRDVLASGAMDIIQPDCCVSGGITEVGRIATLAGTHHVPLSPHVWGGAISLAAALNLAFALPPTAYSLFEDELLFEFDRSANRIRDELNSTPPKFENGFFYPTEAPGLGVEVDEAVLGEFIEE